MKMQPKRLAKFSSAPRLGKRFIVNKCFRCVFQDLLLDHIFSLRSPSMLSYTHVFRLVIQPINYLATADNSFQTWQGVICGYSSTAVKGFHRAHKWDWPVLLAAFLSHPGWPSSPLHLDQPHLVCLLIWLYLHLPRCSLFSKCLPSFFLFGFSPSLPLKKFIYYLFHRGTEKEVEKVRGIFYRLVNFPALGQVAARSQKHHVGLPHGWQEAKHLAHPLLLFSGQ